MSLIINHNTAALQTHRNLSVSGNGLAKSIQKLSSGYKINTGADDPSGLIISEQLRSQISGLERAVRNSSEASNLIGIAEGALTEMNSILKKLRALAIHSANNGITSPDQIAADQAEMDSGIETINRIAATTRYSDQALLNGAKELVYDVETINDSTGDHQLLDNSLTRVDQVYKRDGVVMSLRYAGKVNESQSNTENSAQRAYFEADQANPLCQIKDGILTASQQFTLTGTAGSRQFTFNEGQHLGAIVSAINNSKDSTGVGATLTFASDVRVDKTTNACTKDPDYAATPPTRAEGINYAGGYVYQTGDVQVYNAGLNDPATAKIDSLTITPDASDAFIVGYNCDGDGKIYAKVVDAANNAIEYYKDKDCTMLIGKGGDNFFAAANNSGLPSAPSKNLDGIFIDLNDNAQNLDVYEIAVIGQQMDNLKDMQVGSLATWVDLDTAVMSGVNLGQNTSAEGQVYFEYTPMTFDKDGEVLTFRVDAFSDSSREPKYLVASSGEVNNQLIATPGTAEQAVRLESVAMANGEDSGLNITLNLPAANAGEMPGGQVTGELAFTNLGMRMYSTGYGSAETIRLSNEKGELFYSYRGADTLEKVMVQPDTTVQINGQDAKFSLNGSPVYTTGLVANTTTPDFSGQLVFNAGKLGHTTLAVAGYDEGKLYSKASAIQGIEEDEYRIREERREFEPSALTFPMGDGANGLNDSSGNGVNLYLDFSKIDSSVEARIPSDYLSDANTSDPVKLDNLKNANVNAAYDHANSKLIITMTVSRLDDDGNPVPGEFTTLEIEESVSPEKLLSGFTVTKSELKGLYIATDVMYSNAASSSAQNNRDMRIKPGSVMLEAYTYATNPRDNTEETMSNFVGGMQFQLGNTEGDQDRTIYSIPSMSMSALGRINYEGKEYSMQDVLSGGHASLAKDPVLAMHILTKAVDEVSSLRARLGAFQSNMLQTNMNSLEVAIENITNTEANIRDSDMAAESTEFTRFQIMQQAGTSMLAQANQISQNVLSLLQG